MPARDNTTHPIRSVAGIAATAARGAMGSAQSIADNSWFLARITEAYRSQQGSDGVPYEPTHYAFVELWAGNGGGHVERPQGRRNDLAVDPAVSAFDELAAGETVLCRRAAGAANLRWEVLRVSAVTWWIVIDSLDGPDSLAVGHCIRYAAGSWGEHPVQQSQKVYVAIVDTSLAFTATEFVLGKFESVHADGTLIFGANPPSAGGAPVTLTLVMKVCPVYGLV